MYLSDMNLQAIQVAAILLTVTKEIKIRNYSRLQKSSVESSRYQQNVCVCARVYLFVCLPVHNRLPIWSFIKKKREKTNSHRNSMAIKSFRLLTSQD